VERDAADRLRSAGFEVVLPDLYAGEHTESLEEGFELMAEIGWPLICGRAFQAMERLPESTILAGFSMGAGVVASLWGQRPNSKGVLLLHGLAKIPTKVKPGQKVQTHIADVDPLISSEQKALWAQSAQTARVAAEIHIYREGGHFFTDFNSIDYCARASELTWSRAVEFMKRL
jgi:dienelactone hydrolase